MVCALGQAPRWGNGSTKPSLIGRTRVSDAATLATRDAEVERLRALIKQLPEASKPTPTAGTPGPSH